MQSRDVKNTDRNKLYNILWKYKDLNKMYIIFKCPQMIHMAKIKLLITAT